MVSLILFFVFIMNLMIKQDHEKSFQSMGALQRVIKLNLLSPDNPGLVDGVSFVLFIHLKCHSLF